VIVRWIDRVEMEMGEGEEASKDVGMDLDGWDDDGAGTRVRVRKVVVMEPRDRGRVQSAFHSPRPAMRAQT
jgi:hypothetical protein